jgi:hypothetical protein
MNLEAGLGIESGGRFVEKQHLRVVDEREGERQPLFLPARQLAVGSVALVPEREPAEERVGVDRPRIQAGEQPQRLANGDALREIGGLKADADAILELFGVAAGVEPEDRDLAAVTRP